MTATNKIDWNATDPAYNAIKKASEYFASAELLSRWEDQRDESEEQFERAQYNLKRVNENIATATGGEDPSSVSGGIVNIVTGTYQTYPLSPNAPHRRPGGKGGEVALELYYISPARYD